eukprot:455269-Hanusia_phi.AAC.1
MRKLCCKANFYPSSSAWPATSGRDSQERAGQARTSSQKSCARMQTLSQRSLLSSLAGREGIWTADLLLPPPPTERSEVPEPDAPRFLSEVRALWRS